MLKVYGRPNSSNSAKVFWLLDEIGQEYELVPTGTGYGATDTDAFRALNPFSRVPVVVDGATVIWESNAILRYLASRFGAERLWPGEVGARSIVDAWMDWSAVSLSPAITRWRKSTQSNAQPVGLDAVIAEFTALDNRLSRSTFIAGDALSLADISAAPAVHRWFLLPDTKPDLSNLSRYAARLAGNTGYRLHIQERLS